MTALKQRASEVGGGTHGRIMRGRQRTGGSSVNA